MNEVERSSARTPRRRAVRLLVAAAAVIAVVLVGLAVTKPANRTDAPDAVTPGSVSSITVTEFGTTDAFQLDRFGSKPLVLNTWASWCTFCIAEMPDFESVYREVSPRVEFLGVNVQDIPSEAKRFAESTKVTYPLATDRTAKAFDALGGIGMPTTVFVAPGGRVLEKFTGPLSREALREKIHKYFGI